jgi:hypothetical protein
MQLRLGCRSLPLGRWWLSVERHATTGELRMSADQLIDWSWHAMRQITVRLAAAGVFVAISVTGCGTPTNGFGFDAGVGRKRNGVFH